jgi:hypothetical protein
VSASDGSYSINLNADGSVTNAIWGTPTSLTIDSNLSRGRLFTPNGTTISTSTIFSDTNLRGSGAIEQMDFSSPFFPIGAVLSKAFGSLFGTVGKSISMEASVVEQSASAPISGTVKSPIFIPSGTNAETIISGRVFSGHALNEMQSSGLMPSVIEDVIVNGSRAAGNETGTFVHQLNGVRVITNQSGKVVTAMPRTH